ncbi:MAG: SMC family ATPase [Acidobacteriota bacterium]
MQITRVELRNIKNHAHAEWVFLPGLIAICGPNGSGKTTILEAIAWALFDQLDYKREDFVKRGEKKGQVTVSFISDLDQREYSAQRDTTGSYFVTDVVTKARLAEQRNQVLPWLCQHIGVEPGTDLASLFRTTIGVPQGTFTRDFALRPAERKSVFDHTLKVDEYRDASDRLRLTVKYLETEAARTELAIAAAEGELKAYEKTRSDLESARHRRETLATEFRAVEVEQSSLTREALKLDALSRDLEFQRSSSERLDVKLRLTRDKLASIREAAGQARVAAAIVAASRMGYETYLSVTTRLNDLDQQRAARDKLRLELVAIEGLQIATRARSEHYQRLLDEARSAEQELAQLQVHIGEQTRLEARIASLRESRGTRLGLERELHRIDLELGRMRKRYSDLAREHDIAIAQREVAERAQPLEAERKTLESDIARQEFALQSLKVKREQLEHLARDMSHLLSDQDRTRRDIDGLESLTLVASEANQVAARHDLLTTQLARLRAEVERDSAMVNGLEGGGMCPLLTEKCLNLKPGESLDSRFREGLNSRTHEISRLETASAQLSLDLSQAQEARAYVARLPQLRSDLKRIEDSIGEQLKQMQVVESEIAYGSRDHDGELATAKARRATLEQELIAARAAEQLFNRADSLRVEVEAIKEEGKLMRDEREEIAARLRDIIDVDSALKESEEQLSTLSNPRARADSIKHQLTRADQWKVVVEAAEVEARRIAGDIGTLSRKLGDHSTLEDQLIDAKASRAGCDADYRAFIANEQAAVNADRREQEAAEIAVETEQTESAFALAVAEHDRLSMLYEVTRHSQVRAQIEEIQRRGTQLATQLEHANEETARLETQLARLEEVRTYLHSQIAERTKLVQLAETADFIRTTLVQAAPYITEAYLFSISHEANQLYREITGRHDVTLRWSREYEITLEEDGRDRPFSTLSGGEQMAGALAIRLALLRELSEIDLAFFDEPTANLDEERRRNLAQQIGRIKHFKQLFVVSHDDSFEAYTDQVIILSEKPLTPSRSP